MNIRQQAEADLAFTLEDDVTGFGISITVTDPSGTSATVIGQSNDISAAIDPETDQLIGARTATVSIRLSTLAAAGLDIPRAIVDSNTNPWLISFTNLHSEVFNFKVVDSAPDRTLGFVTCILEFVRIV